MGTAVRWWAFPPSPRSLLSDRALEAKPPASPQGRVGTGGAQEWVWGCEAPGAGPAAAPTPAGSFGVRGSTPAPRLLSRTFLHPNIPLSLPAHPASPCPSFPLVPTVAPRPLTHPRLAPPASLLRGEPRPALRMLGARGARGAGAGGGRRWH